MKKDTVLTLTCRSCGTPISGSTPEELTTAVQDHVKQHGHDRPITAAHIHARLKQDSTDDQGCGSTGAEG